MISRLVQMYQRQEVWWAAVALSSAALCVDTYDKLGQTGEEMTMFGL